MSMSVTIPELGDFTVEPPSEGVADLTDEIASSP
jgi:hypothetical protein